MILFLLTAGEGISIHTLCEEGDRIDKLKLDFFTNFNPHPLWRGRLSRPAYRHTIGGDFNPHPLWRGRLVPHSDNDITIKFQSTPSVKRATRVFPDLCASYDISIHTLCEEGDDVNKFKQILQGISIHTLCEEGDGRGVINTMAAKIFQSTPSVKRATRWRSMFSNFFWYFNPHPLWRGRLLAEYNQWVNSSISIHTLCEEGDYFKCFT